jgi:hypothetical protein
MLCVSTTKFPILLDDCKNKEFEDQLRVTMNSNLSLL